MVLPLNRPECPATNPFPQSIAVADFNGDGKLGHGRFGLQHIYSTQRREHTAGQRRWDITAGSAFPLTGQNVNNAAVGDFNGDGKPDLAISLPDANLCKCCWVRWWAEHVLGVEGPTTAKRNAEWEKHTKK
jgi:hypothetical protein